MPTTDGLPDLGLRPVASYEGLATLTEPGSYPPRGARTSDSDPFAVAWVDIDGLPGRLGIAMAPGRRDRTAAAVWWRDLHADLRRLRHVHQVHTLVTLLPDAELNDLGIADLAGAADVHGVACLRLPIRDGSVPAPPQTDEVMALLLAIVALLLDGRTVVVHCRAGQGRSGMVAAMVLAIRGAAPPEAIAQVRRVQPRAVETVGQEAYVSEAATTWGRRRLGDR